MSGHDAKPVGKVTHDKEPDTKVDLDSVEPHRRMDEKRRNDNIDAGVKLCKRCEGTGNELFSMYRKCSACGGTGDSEYLETLPNITSPGNNTATMSSNEERDKS